MKDAGREHRICTGTHSGRKVAGLAGAAIERQRASRLFSDSNGTDENGSTVGESAA